MGFYANAYGTNDVCTYRAVKWILLATLPTLAPTWILSQNIDSTFTNGIGWLVLCGNLSGWFAFFPGSCVTWKDTCRKPQSVYVCTWKSKLSKQFIVWVFRSTLLPYFPTMSGAKPRTNWLSLVVFGSEYHNMCIGYSIREVESRKLIIYISAKKDAEWWLSAPLLFIKALLKKPS